MRNFTLSEIAQHNKKDDLWIIIHGKIYDLTTFLPEHPGGQKVILKCAGKDATSAFDSHHPPDMIERFLSPDVCIGQPVMEKSHEDNANIKRQQTETDEEERIQLARKNMPSIDELYNAYDFESVAKTILSDDAWGYISSGTDDEITMRENHSAYHRIWFRPRVMVDVSKIDMTTHMLGQKASLPFYITAAAFCKTAHPNGEMALTRAAGRKDIIQMIPTYASCSFKDIVRARISSNQIQWYQLYVTRDRKATQRIVEEAEAKGMKGLFVTVDTPELGRHLKEMRINNQRDDPSEMETGEGTVSVSSFFDPSLNWSDIAWLKSITKMPILLKGVTRLEDAVLSAQHGLQGVVLSNHGGRQMDFAPSTIEILPEVMGALQREGLDKNFEVYIDGGIRRGSDIFKAIALGAKGVGIGRPFLYAMACYGERGVERLIDLFQAELTMCMRLMGAPTIADIKPDMVDIRNLKDHFVANPTDYLAKYAYERMQPRGKLSKL
ncbi:FMN-dependent dehydrogenase-domain-containing protein [Phascolomyces articulosus]|uniref:L-lactate dehydrogenase (cytochrome) n=1 Tax=Phascolomyces articulosus TaxID=60185 RepID=A0AAD5K345_9FUNG|nr:FMN-dependent dehydrogenase-domain-containing protein [Phascolomyces articulosus]